MWLNSIKRRFSSTEVLDDARESDEKERKTMTNRAETASNPRPPVAERSGLSLNTSSSGQPAPSRPPPIRKNPSPSAPSSPTKSLSLAAMMTAAKDLIANTTTAATSANPIFSSSTQKSGVVKRKILLIVDESSVDWAKFFRGKRIGDYELRVEQVCEINQFLFYFS